jgi:hypothetical protein
MTSTLHRPTLAIPDGSPGIELATRESHGITVRLLWSRSKNLVTVTVEDTANDDYFELVLDEHERALDVFDHPFAYAAARGVEFGASRSEPELLEVVWSTPERSRGWPW